MDHSHRRCYSSRLKDRLGAELLAAAFEDVAIEDAAVLEARLGVLTQALVVDDPIAAAHATADRADELVDVLLVPRDADLQCLVGPSLSAVTGEQNVIINEGAAPRISRIPCKQRLGRHAREKRAADLRARAEVKSRDLDVARGERRRLGRLVADGDALLAGLEVWLAGDPAEALREVEEAISLADAELERQRETADCHAAAAHALLP